MEAPSVLGPPGGTSAARGRGRAGAGAQLRAPGRAEQEQEEEEEERRRREEEEEEEEEQEEAAVPWEPPPHLNDADPEGSLGSKIRTWLRDCGLSQLLAWWHSDAEEILHNLGFVGAEPGVASRVPPRFFSAPSRASGIDLGLFLRAQVRRLEMEDPCVLLASA
ncbi:hypothetical protein DUI87_00448 [Hirundo rustica rustica]|uniref:ITPR-interacting domain-containing protein n=1 Tax=Hirundo rustica rustica TaxID=333673 RepID=A0A3M0LC01_HIRRU|nr:hypothetical protein DUI87_00448 [Hirundo rustica rustica]